MSVQLYFKSMLGGHIKENGTIVLSLKMGLGYIGGPMSNEKCKKRDLENDIRWMRSILPSMMKLMMSLKKKPTSREKLLYWSSKIGFHNSVFTSDLWVSFSLTFSGLMALFGYKIGYVIVLILGRIGGILLTLCLSSASWVCGKTSSSVVVSVVVTMWVGSNLARYAPLPQGALLAPLYMSIKLQVDLN